MGIGKILALGARRKRLSSIIFGSIIGAIIFAAILAWAGPGKVWNNLGNVDYTDLAMYVALAVLTYLLRAWRFRLLVNRGTTSKFYGIVSVHTLMINFLPFSSGDISYPLLLKRYGMSDGFLQGVPSLLIARAQDIFINLSLVVIAVILAGNTSLILEVARGEFALWAVLALVVAGIVGWLAYKNLGRMSAKVRRVVGFVATAFSAIRQTTPRVWATTFLLTLSIRVVTLIAVFYLLGSAGVTLPLPAVFLIASLYVFLPLLPVNTLAGLGVTEAYLLGFFLINGLDRGFAVAASLQIHATQLVVSAVLGAIGLLYLEYLRKRTMTSTMSPSVGQESGHPIAISR